MKNIHITTPKGVILLDDIQINVHRFRDNSVSSTLGFDITHVQGLIIKVIQLQDVIDTNAITKVDFEYTLKQVQDKVNEQLAIQNIDTVQPATYIAMLDAFIKILNDE